MKNHDELFSQLGMIPSFDPHHNSVTKNRIRDVGPLSKGMTMDEYVYISNMLKYMLNKSPN